MLTLMLLWFLSARAVVLPPPWASQEINPCAEKGWQLLYWPPDGRCYTIFKRGPCPATMELAPRSNGTAECRCPPLTAQSPRDALCHKLYSRGPCSEGQYFAPVPTRSRRLWGACREVEACEDPTQARWPRDERCYQVHTRGPCIRGKLVVHGEDGLARCECTSHEELAEHRWQHGGGDACYEHYTRGPCDHGSIFLPGGTCGCPRDTTHFHQPTGRCYQAGHQGPCQTGRVFLAGECACKDQYVPWEGSGACYLPYTQGPCEHGHVLVNSTTCAPWPCRKGRLYLPEEAGCYAVGSRGPCPAGQLILFHEAGRGSGSQLGACGCPGPDPCPPAPPARCEARVDGRCHPLYRRGPCPAGQWVVPPGRCRCLPGYHEDSSTGTCLSPIVRLAKFLNDH